MGEFWVEGVPADDATHLGIGAGLDWTAPFGAHLLLGGGSGVADRGAPGIDWCGYVGLQWAFDKVC
jgi:hypothetical protein